MSFRQLVSPMSSKTTLSAPLVLHLRYNCTCLAFSLIRKYDIEENNLFAAGMRKFYHRQLVILVVRKCHNDDLLKPLNYVSFVSILISILKFKWGF